VVAVEDLPGHLDVEIVGRVDAPGHRGRPLQIVAGHPVLRRAGFEDRQFLHLLLDPLQDRLGGVQCLQTLLEHLDVGAAVILLDAQLLLDGLHLLAQEELALPDIDLAVDLLADLALQPGHLQLLLEQGQDPLHPRQHRQGGEDGL